MKKTAFILFISLFLFAPLSFISAEMPPPPPDSNNIIDDNANDASDNYSDNNNFTQATLMRAQGDYKVYEIKNGKRHWIPTAQVFNYYRFNWQDIQVVPPSTLLQYPRASLLRAEGDPKVYYLTESGMIRHIPNKKVFNSYNDKWEDVIIISPEELQSYEPNNLIRLSGGYKVYLLKNGIKHWIKTAEAFNRLGYDWSKIAPVNQTELNSYPEGSVLE